MDSNNVIIDTGSYQIKAGYLGETVPRFIIEPIVGSETLRNITTSGDSKYFGYEAKKDPTLTLSYPIDKGIITKCDDFIHLFKFICNRLGVNIAGSSVVLTEATLYQSETKEEIVKVLFETLDVENLCLSNQFQLVLKALDMETGLVLQSGHSVTHTVPIFEGYSIPHAACHVPYAGDNITSLVMKLIRERGAVFKTLEDLTCAQLIKEENCALWSENEKIENNENNLDESKYYRLSNEYIYYGGSEALGAAEELFNLIDYQYNGLQDMVFESITGCFDDEVQRNITNIVLSGGTTLIPGFTKRLREKLPSSLQYINIMEASNRQNLSYIGAAKLPPVSSSTNNIWVSNKEYQEYGPSIIRYKWF